MSSYLLGDNWAERVFAAILLVPVLPVIGVLVLLIRLTSPGPGIFRQERVGSNGKTYTMFKLRSMHCEAESQTGRGLVDTGRSADNTYWRPFSAKLTWTNCLSYSTS